MDKEVSNIEEPRSISEDKGSGRKKFLILAVLLLMTTGIASSYGAALILPQKLVEIDSMEYFSLFSASSSMGMMLALPLVGVFCSKFGVKAVTLFGVFFQLFTRILIMFTTHFILFEILWTLTGFSVGLYMSAPYAIMAEIVTEEERPKYYGLITTFSALGALAGPAFTGMVIDWVSTDMALIAYILFAIIPVVGLLLFYPNRKRPSTGTFDILGIVLLVGAVSSIVMFLSLGGIVFPFISSIGISLFLIGIVCLISLIKIENTHKNPSVPIHMFKRKRFRNTFIIQLLLVAYSTSVAAFGIVYVQQVMGASSLASSTITMPQTIVQAILGFFVGSYVGKNFKKNFRPVALLALICYTAGLIIFTTLQPNSSMIIIYIASLLGGIGQAVTQSVFAPFFQTELKQDEFAAAQGMYQFGSTGGSSLFIAICGAVINMGATYNQVFMLGTVFCALSLVIGFFGFRFPKEELSNQSAENT